MTDSGQGKSKQPITRRQFLARAGLVGIALACADVGSRLDERDWLEVEHVDVPIAGWPRALDGFPIGHMADFHCHGERSRARIERAATLLLRERPEMVALTGDFVTAGVMTWMNPCAKALAPLAAVRHGAYAVLGNHDWWCGRPDHVVAELRKTGIRVLRNRCVTFPELDLCLTGLDDVWMRADNLAVARRTAAPARHQILLVHEPDYADRAGPGFGLQLSGHSHAGQVRLPGLPPLHTPYLGSRYVEGLEQSPTHPVYTTRGIGTTGLPIRFHCPPEITVIHLRAAQSVKG